MKDYSGLDCWKILCGVSSGCKSRSLVDKSSLDSGRWLVLSEQKLVNDSVVCSSMH
jgi:hypothetical protein